MPLLCLKDPQRCLLLGFCSGELRFSVFTCLSLQFEKWGQLCALWPSCCFFSLFSFLFVVWMKWQFLSSFCLFWFVCFPKLFTRRIGSRKSLPASLLSLMRVCARAHTHTHSLIYLFIFGCLRPWLRHVGSSSSVWPAELLGSLAVVCRLSSCSIWA